MNDTDLVEARAEQIARATHAGQTDKAGEPYIGHVERVAGRLSDPLDRAVAWLHDVLEDTDVVIDDLWAAGIPDDVAEDVKLLTHAPNEPRDVYYRRVAKSDRARRVKLADIADNSDPSRLAALDEETRARLLRKYAKAREALTVQEAT